MRTLINTLNKEKRLMDRFDVPVCLFTWKRWDAVKQIIERLREANVQKIYVKSDCWRNESEKEQVLQVRENLKKAFDWDCQVIYLFEDENKGVFKQIGLGAVEIFKKEEMCIFIEDDNLPDETFFEYCRELLRKYKDNEKVLMIAGTNYAGKWDKCDSDYMFVKALLPCGWASWSSKFLKYYDQKLDWFDSKENCKKYLKFYRSKALAKQQLGSILAERNLFKNEGRFRSWDYHLIGSLMRNDLLVASPKYNQIKNIGVDGVGIHDLKKYKKNVMTKRFCEIETYHLEFPLKHPASISVDKKYQKFCDKTITCPLRIRIKSKFAKI